MTETQTRPDAREATVRLAALKALLDKVKAAYDEARRDALTALDPGDRKTAVLPSGANIGTVTYTDAKTTAKVTNPAALLAWVRNTAPDEVVTVETVRDSYIGALIGRAENHDGDAYDRRTGESIPGLKFVTGEPYVRAVQSETQLAAFAHAYLHGEMGGTLALPLLTGWPDPPPDDAWATGSVPVGEPS